jgi:hypothetical protein
MKTITLKIDDEAHGELSSWLSFQKMTGNDHTPEFQFVFEIFYEMYKGSDTVTITKEVLEQGMRNLK